MKAPLRHLPLLLPLALVWGACSEAPAPAPATAPAQARPVRARLRAPAGDVQVKGAQEAAWRPARDGQPLYENDAVRTAADAHAELEFLDGSRVRLLPDTLAGVAESAPRPGQDRSDLTVVRGRVDAELGAPAQQNLSVNTPAATVRAGREIVFQ